MKTNKTFWHSLLILITGMLFTLNLHAQVTIGDETDPQSFSLLEISTAKQTGGLRLPQLTTTQRDALFSATNPPAEADGLLIFNTTNNKIEYWNKTKWISL